MKTDHSCLGPSFFSFLFGSFGVFSDCFFSSLFKLFSVFLNAVSFVCHIFSLKYVFMFFSEGLYIQFLIKTKEFSHDMK